MINFELSLSVTLVTVAFIAYSVLTNNKYVGSFIQLGDIQRREEVHKEIHQTKVTKPAEALEVPVIERISFTVGVVNACCTMYILGIFIQFFL